ncbi:MAG: PAS domain-containing protein [Candidatus Omnitrophota bacterium]
MIKNFSPIRTLLNIIFSIFVCEAIVMYFISIMAPISDLHAIILDSTLLVIILSPVLYLFLFRPMALEIEDIKLTEHKLRDSREMGQLVMDNIPQFIFWKDTRSAYLGCNENFAKVAGVGKPEKIVGKTDYDLAWKKEEADFYREADRRVMYNDKAEYHIIEPQLQASGKQAWLDTNKVPLHDENGKVVGVLGTYEDITERRNAEEDLMRRDYQLEILSRTSVHINAVLEVPVIMRTLIASAMELVGTEKGAAGRIVDGKMVFTEYYKEGKPIPVNYCFERGQGIPGHVMETRKLYFTNDASKDQFVLQNRREEIGFHSVVNVPIISRKGDILGCFEIYDKFADKDFDVQDFFMLQGLAASAAVALENAYRFTSECR